MHTGLTAQTADTANAPTNHTGLPAGTLRLRNPRHRVHPRAMLWWTLRSAVFWLVVILIQVAVRVFADQPPSWLTITLIISAAAGVLQAVVEPQWRYRVHHWEATQDAVFTRSGWIRQEWRVAPVSRIQTVDTKRGPIEIAGLAHEDAARLVDELTATTQATAGDAT
jgi:membrane protein YdbS with pleckstrin-like domain